MITFKNNLVTSRFITNQQQLSNTIFVKPVQYARVLCNLPYKDRKTYLDSTYQYCWYGCNTSTMNYYRIFKRYNIELSMDTRADHRDVSEDYINKIKTLPMYHVYKNYKNYKNYDKNKWNESLWFNVNNAAELINITGNYDITPTKHGSYFTPNNTLYLNGLPVNYIHMNVHNTTNGRNICIKLHFSHNLTHYCNMIDYVLACYYRRFKYILFSYLPIEIIQYILHLTSIC